MRPIRGQVGTVSGFTLYCRNTRILRKQEFTPEGEGGSGRQASATENILVGLVLKLIFMCNHNL